LLRSADEAEQQCQAVKRDIYKVKEQKEDLSVKADKIEEQKVIQMPRVKDALSLYITISKIRWDYDTANISGFVATENDVRPFEMDPSLSQFETVNRLWTLTDV